MKNAILSTVLEGLRRLDEQVDRANAREAAKQDFVVRLECQGHVVAVNRRALSEEEAKASAQRLCPAYRVFACELDRRVQE